MSLPSSPPARSVYAFQVLGRHPRLTWQVAIALAIGLIGLGAANAGAGYIGILLFMLSAFTLLVTAMGVHALLTYDLPLLREGAIVRATVQGPSDQSRPRRPLYNVLYAGLGDTSEMPRQVPALFLARNGYQPSEGESVFLAVDPRDPERVVEVTGLYDDLVALPR